MKEDTIGTASHLQSKLLVVEDEANVRQFCHRLLHFNGYDVSTAENGHEAAALLRDTRYDLVLTDLNMPGMGGIELLQYIQDHHPDVDKIVFTAFAEVGTARQALKLGAFDYLTKPIDTDDLERTVRKCLELRRIRKEKESLSELLVMHQFSQAIANSLNVETQVAQTISFLGQRFAPELLSVSLRIPEEQELCLLIYETRHNNTLPQMHKLPLDPDCTEEQLVQTHMRLIGGIGTDQAHLMAGSVLRTHDRPIGCMHLTRAAEQPAFDTNERTLLDVFASHIAASLDNSRLYQQLKEQNIETMAALAAAIDARDPYTFGHSEQVTNYAVRLAQALELPTHRIERLRYAGLMHDVGKIGIRDHILLKPCALSDQEFAVMKQHPSIGATIIGNIRSLRDTLPIIEGHHEQINGGGYPNGLTGDKLSLETRILAVADAFDAMTSDRAYRAAMDPEDALAILINGRDSKWDAHIVDTFVELIRAEGEELHTKSAYYPVQEAFIGTAERAVNE